MPARHRVVVLGGGFGGLRAARALGGAPVEVTLIDRRNFHLFQPLLYQVATGGLSPANIAAPLRAILKRRRNVTVLLGEAVDLDPAGRRLSLADGEVGYDTLVVATGVSHHYFGRPEWAPLAPGLKTIEDATEIRRRLLLAFERAEREGDPERRRALLTFLIVGAGPTGVELAGALAELARHTLSREFRHIDPAEARIVLVEGTDRVLPAYSARLSRAAAHSLAHLGVEALTGVLVTELAPGQAVLRRGTTLQTLATETVLWAAGVAGSSFGRILAERAGAALDRSGRVMVQPDLSIHGHPEILVIGDLACFTHQGGTPLPGVAQVAMQQGAYAARLVCRRIAGHPVGPFRYRDLGNMATIGRNAGVAEVLGLGFSGRLAWLLWLFVHLMNLVEFESRELVFLQWAWSYATWNRSARLITASTTRGEPSREK